MCKLLQRWLHPTCKKLNYRDDLVAKQSKLCHSKDKSLNDTNSFCNMTLEAQHVDEDTIIAIMKITRDKNK